MNEDARQIVHFLVGMAAIGLTLLFGKVDGLAFLAVLFILGLVLLNYKMRGGSSKLDFMLKLFGRETENPPGFGAVTLFVGVLLLLAFIRPEQHALALVAIFAIGDSLATIIGRRSTHKLLWNSNKSIEGTVTFVISGFLVALLFVSPKFSLAYAVLLAAAESIDWKLDDNLATPLIAVLFNLILLATGVL